MSGAEHKPHALGLMWNPGKDYYPWELHERCARMQKPEVHDVSWQVELSENGVWMWAKSGKMEPVTYESPVITRMVIAEIEKRFSRSSPRIQSRAASAELALTADEILVDENRRLASIVDRQAARLWIAKTVIFGIAALEMLLEFF